MKILTLTIAAVFVFSGCGSKPDAVDKEKPLVNQAGTPVTSPSTPKNGDYPGHGRVVKINNELGSVELKHDEIKGIMPAMQMEFYVSDKALLKGLNVGDEVDFSLRYKDAQETIVAIARSK